MQLGRGEKDKLSLPSEITGLSISDSVLIAKGYLSYHDELLELVIASLNRPLDQLGY